ncbi:hypothetical protein E2C01_076595 [Portunus trituberculatus]|uniref:Uncharacterized protein n=1 Tax=Portunus trituberculatus TaxID=210409 RepID=A0A5B7II20_PORTR|nr:hypothetical protein [Portunus trituberculatus]
MSYSRINKLSFLNSSPCHSRCTTTITIASLGRLKRYVPARSCQVIDEDKRARQYFTPAIQARFCILVAAMRMVKRGKRMMVDYISDYVRRLFANKRTYA